MKRIISFDTLLKHFGTLAAVFRPWAKVAAPVGGLWRSPGRAGGRELPPGRPGPSRRRQLTGGPVLAPLEAWPPCWRGGSTSGGAPGLAPGALRARSARRCVQLGHISPAASAPGRSAAASGGFQGAPEAGTSPGYSGPLPAASAPRRAVLGSAGGPRPRAEEDGSTPGGEPGPP